MYLLQIALEKEQGLFFSCELNVFAEHLGQGMLGLIGTHCNKSSNLVLMELGQRLVLPVKHDSLVTKYPGD